MHMERYRDSPDLHEGPSVHRKLLEDRSHIYIGINMLVVPSGLTPTRVSALVSSKFTCAALVERALACRFPHCGLHPTTSMSSQYLSSATERTTHTSLLPTCKCTAAMPNTMNGMCPRLLIGCWAMAPARSSAQTLACRWTSSG
jgi:hypothetical protein